jgi:hypothetical protein
VRVGVVVRWLSGRCSDWILAHPVRWVAGSGGGLVVLGLALDRAPAEVIAAGAAMGVLNVLHARRRGDCPLPAELGDHAMPAAVEHPDHERSDDRPVS